MRDLLMGVSEARPSALLSPAFPGSGISALCLPPAAASQPSPRGALILTCSASGFQFLFLWCVYGPANLDGQQVRGNSFERGKRLLERAKGILLTVRFPNLLRLPSYRLPLVQAPSLEFLIPALVLTNQKPSLTTKTTGNGEYRVKTG